MIRLYAHLAASFRTVSEGLKEAFEELGVLSGYVVGEQQDFDTEVIPGAAAPIAVVVGDPMRVLMAHLQGDHKEIWLMLAPNSEGISPKFIQELTVIRRGRKTVDGFLAPSTWAKAVLEKAFPDIPVRLCQHGVLKAFQLNEGWRNEALEMLRKDPVNFVALHVASAVARKGTAELVQAWLSLKAKKKIEGLLLLSCNPRLAAEFEALAPGEESIRVVHGQTWDTPTYNRLLQQHVHLIIQPSRAEGFGLVPLEARVCGVPVVMTANTGHLDQLDAVNGEVALVKSGPSAESDDYWGATAPTVVPEDIESAVWLAYEHIEHRITRAVLGAETTRKHWTWARGASEVVEYWRKKYEQQQ